MASATVTTHNFYNRNNSNSGSREISREEIQSAIAKAVEMRSLHAALMQSNSPANLRQPSPSTASRPASQFNAQEYPIFTPGQLKVEIDGQSYEDDSLPGYPHTHAKCRRVSESWDYNDFDSGNGIELDTVLTDCNRENSFSRKGLPSGHVCLESHTCPIEDYKSATGSCTNHITVLQTSTGNDYFKSSRRNSLGDSKSVSSCNKYKPAIITTESENGRSNGNSYMAVPLTDSHPSVTSQPKSKKMISWLFPMLKKKHKNKNFHSPDRTESVVSHVFKDFRIMSIETLKKELVEANERRDAALMEVAEMKSSFGELKHKLEYLETYCEELKKALRQAMQTKDIHLPQKLGNLHRRGNSSDEHGDNLMPVSKEAMVEGFLQIASEARLSVKQFCKILIGNIDDTDNTSINNINTLLQPYKLSLNAKYSKAVLYHIEAFVNQSVYQDFENCAFQKNGSPKHLDPQQDRQAQFSSFAALRNLSWNEILRKGTKYYSEDFSEFCDHKMSCIVTALHWTRPWPEHLLQAFFVAAKCIWLLHLLAFSFNPPLGILRIEENRSFDPLYMEDMSTETQRSVCPFQVRLMVIPGFYVEDKLLKCKVLCRYKSAG